MDSLKLWRVTAEPILAVAGIVAKTLDTPTYKNIPVIKVPEDGTVAC